ncbi:MAG: hypothetical protein L0H25_05575 [Micrococcales bacterium]|nr:hypothetical protein [Micrococcales bacterium]
MVDAARKPWHGILVATSLQFDDKGDEDYGASEFKRHAEQDRVVRAETQALIDAGVN